VDDCHLKKTKSKSYSCTTGEFTIELPTLICALEYGGAGGGPIIVVVGRHHHLLHPARCYPAACSPVTYGRYYCTLYGTHVHLYTTESRLRPMNP
jgi:hypothetical protein